MSNVMDLLCCMDWITAHSFGAPVRLPRQKTKDVTVEVL